MAISVGDAVLHLGIDTKDVDKGLKGLGAKIKQHQKAIGIGMIAMGGIMTAISIKAIKTASDVEEMTAKFDTVFRDSADAVRDWAKVTAKAMGRSRFAFMEMAASVQDTFVPMGFARDVAAELSKKLTVLAVDVASFNNKLDADVMRDFQSALVGNTETVRKYGIVITAVGVEQEILDQGWAKSKKEITEAMKVQARMNLILKGTTDAQGDAIRTAGSFANQMKKLEAEVEEVTVQIGEALLPAVSDLLDELIPLVEKLKEWADLNPELSKGIVKWSAGIGLAGIGLGGLLLILPGVVIALKSLGVVMTFIALHPIVLLIATLVMLAGVFYLLFETLRGGERPFTDYIDNLFNAEDATNQFASAVMKETMVFGAEMEAVEGATVAENAHTDALKEAAEAYALLIEEQERYMRQLSWFGVPSAAAQVFGEAWGEAGGVSGRMQRMAEEWRAQGRGELPPGFLEAWQQEMEPGRRSIQGDVYLDGEKMGTWVSEDQGRRVSERSEMGG